MVTWQSISGVDRASAVHAVEVFLANCNTWSDIQASDVVPRWRLLDLMPSAEAPLDAQARERLMRVVLSRWEVDMRGRIVVSELSEARDRIGRRLAKAGIAPHNAETVAADIRRLAHIPDGALGRSSR